MFLKLDKVLVLKGMRSIQEAVSKVWFEEIFTLIVHTHYDRDLNDVGYAIDGSLCQHEFSFTRSGQKVASVSNNYWGWSDSYGVDIIDG